MIIIEPKKFKNFKEYYQSLSESAKKNCKYALKNNSNLTYQKINFEESLVLYYMDLWEKQLVRGGAIKWGFGIERLKILHAKNRLMLFRSEISMQFIELKDGYWDCHPPMYDKKSESQACAKFMWFSLINYAIENRFEPLNLGGGPDDWVECIKRRHEFPNSTYKWMYVPEYVKLKPEDQPAYYLTKKLRRLRVKTPYFFGGFFEKLFKLF